MVRPQSSQYLLADLFAKRCALGFSLPLALGFGLIILILGQTMILRAYQQRITALSRSNGNNAQAVAEIGVTRYRAFLNRYRELALYSSCPMGQESCPEENWQKASQLLADKICRSSNPTFQAPIWQAIATKNTSEWQAVDSNDPRQGSFRLISYEPVKENNQVRRGKLIVEGRIDSAQSSSSLRLESENNPSDENADQRSGNNRSTDTTSHARLQVTLPITPTGPGRPPNLYPYPGLWLQTLDANPLPTPTSTPPAPRLSLQGNVFINDCGVDLTSISPNPPQTVTAYRVLRTDIPMPTLPPLPVPLPLVEPPLSLSQSQPSITYAYALGTVNRSLTLPRATDVPSPLSPNSRTQVYRYLIDAINLPRTGRLRVDASLSRETLSTSVEVELYVKGSLGSTGRLEHICDSEEGCQPTDLKVFVYQNATNPPINGQYPKFCFAANQTFKGFLLAPGYQVGLANRAKVEGSIWAYAWNFTCASNPETTIFTQSGNWGRREIMLPTQLGTLQQWQRLEVAEEAGQ